MRITAMTDLLFGYAAPFRPFVPSQFACCLRYRLFRRKATSLATLESSTGNVVTEKKYPQKVITLGAVHRRQRHRHVPLIT